MSTPRRAPAATATIDTGTLDVTEGRVSLESRRVPYARATLKCPLLDPEDVDDLDPRQLQRVIITAGDEITGQSRTFDLSVRGRTVHHDSKTVELEAASDEALLDWAPLTIDTGARAHEASARAVCAYVLGKIGAALAPGGPDADVTAYWPVTNLMKNARFAATADGWGTWQNSSAIQRVGFGAAAALRWTATAAADSAIGTTALYTVKPGDWYCFAVDVGGSSNRTAFAGIRWWTGSGTITMGTVWGDPGTTPTAQPSQRVWVIAQAPPGADRAQPVVRTTGNNVAGIQYYISSTQFHEGEELVPFFVGVTPPANGYTYKWADATDPNNTAAQRIPDVERLPELYRWKPGVTAWDFLEPILSSAGLLLFCDEARVWRLIRSADYSLPGKLVLSGAVATAGTDEITRDDPEAWCTGIVVRYRWRDAFGTEREATDVAGDPGTVWVVNLPHAYPGPGAAAQILARRQGRGRTQTVTALSDLGATPRMQASISLPGTTEQQGQVTAVAWNLATGLMDVETTALIDIITGSIDSLTGSIDSL